MPASHFLTTRRAPCISAAVSAANERRTGSIGFSLCSLRFPRVCKLGLRNLGPTILRWPLQFAVSAEEYLMHKPLHGISLRVKFFRIRSYKKCLSNSFSIRSYKNIGLKAPSFHTLTKNIGGYPSSPDARPPRSPASPYIVRDQQCQAVRSSPVTNHWSPVTGLCTFLQDNSSALSGILVIEHLEPWKVLRRLCA